MATIARLALTTRVSERTVTPEAVCSIRLTGVFSAIRFEPGEAGADNDDVHRLIGGLLRGGLRRRRNGGSRRAGRRAADQAAPRDSPLHRAPASLAEGERERLGKSGGGRAGSD
jgi:hypothetical protein